MMIEISALKGLPQWVAWKVITRQKADGTTVNVKLPISPHTGKAASSVDPSTWATASEAWSAKKRYQCLGIGYVFTLAAGVVGVDLDDCFEDGQIRPYAADVVACLNSYTELSPSGKGLHILVSGTIPHSITAKLPYAVEIYNEGRYFTVTGQQYKSAGYVADRPMELEAIWSWAGGDYDEKPLPEARPSSSQHQTTIEDCRAMLAAIPPTGDYVGHWLAVLMAVHSEFPGEAGVEMCEAWSPGYKGEIRQKFNSFKRDSGVSIGTLVHLAKQHGWKPAAKQETKTAWKPKATQTTYDHSQLI